MHPASPAIADPIAKAISFSRLTGIAHRPGCERILAERAPGAAGARLAEEMQRREHDAHRPEQEEVLLLPRRQLVAEEAQRVDVGDPVRARRSAPARAPIGFAALTKTTNACPKKSVTIAR